MTTPDIIKVFREKFGTGYVDPLNHSVREIVRDEHEKFLLQALSAREKEIVAGIEGSESDQEFEDANGIQFTAGWDAALKEIVTEITKGEI